MYLQFAIVVAFAFLFALVAGRIEKTWVSAPMVYITFGLIVGPLGLGWLTGDVTRDEVRVLCDLTLALVLFSDAAGARFDLMRSHLGRSSRMLALGLPLGILFGTLLGLALFPDVPVLELALLATMLAATDAALGKAGLKQPSVPARLRESLNFESGLNDGLAVPVLLVLITLIEADTDMPLAVLVTELFLGEIGIGVLVGVGLVLVGGRLSEDARERGWIKDTWQPLPVLLLAMLCFSTAQSLHGSGYIAAFVGGLTFGRVAGDARTALVHESEQFGELLSMLTWVVFGAAVIAAATADFGWIALVYALASLVVVRPLAVLCSLTGSDTTLPERLFLGWFGPRGLASLAFAVIVLNADVPHAQGIALVVITTVLLSAILHGLSANPLSTLLAKQGEQAHGK